MRTQRAIFPCLMLLSVVALTALLGLLARSATATAAQERPADGMTMEAEPTAPSPIRTVVIDAGHGGEDCGALSAAGLLEKDVNLAVAFALRDLLEANGIPVVMTRTEDVLLYDRGADYKGRKKVLDLAARLAVANETEDSLFVSIHMNAFPQTRYSGMQVWYGTRDERSRDVAQSVQTAALALQPDNNRKIKAAGSNIFLLDNLDTPAILVECGFLSNPEEASRLGDEEYQKQLAFIIFGAIAAHMR